MAKRNFEFVRCRAPQCGPKGRERPTFARVSLLFHLQTNQVREVGIVDLANPIEALDPGTSPANHRRVRQHRDGLARTLFEAVPAAVTEFSRDTPNFLIEFRPSS